MDDLLTRLTDGAMEAAMPASPARKTATQTCLSGWKDRIAADLETLLNSRCVSHSCIDGIFPQTARSLYRYGMRDFSSLSLANPADRNLVCRSIAHAIGHHEKRLSQVRVTLHKDSGSPGRLRFVIDAVLVLSSLKEPVIFNAQLHASTLHYAVSRLGRPARSR